MNLFFILFFLSRDQQDKFTKQNESEFLQGSVAWCCFTLFLSLCIYLAIYIRLYKSCSNFSQLGKRDFPKFIHLIFFFSKSNWAFTNNSITSRSRNRFLSAVFWAVTCRGFISGWWKSTHAFLLHMCFTSLALPLKSNTEMHLENFTVEMQTTTFVVSSILRLKQVFN